MKNKSNKKVGRYFWYDFVKVTGFVPAYIWLRPKIVRESDNVPKRIKGGVLIASNHVTYIDPIILHLAFPHRRLHSIATKDIARTKLRRFFFKTANCIFIDKQNFSMASLREICDHLKEEKAVVIFPESSVAEQNVVRDYKSGVVLMSLLSKKPILPVCIIRGKTKFSRVKVVIGEPIDVAAMYGSMPSMEQMEMVSKMLQQKEQELLEKYQNK